MRAEICVFFSSFCNYLIGLMFIFSLWKKNAPWETCSISPCSIRIFNVYDTCADRSAASQLMEADLHPWRIFLHRTAAEFSGASSDINLDNDSCREFSSWKDSLLISLPIKADTVLFCIGVSYQCKCAVDLFIHHQRTQNIMLTYITTNKIAYYYFL